MLRKKHQHKAKTSDVISKLRTRIARLTRRGLVNDLARIRIMRRLRRPPVILLGCDVF
jgi:hypothetical protein